jgi:hypothetical protein
MTFPESFTAVVVALRLFSRQCQDAKVQIPQKTALDLRWYDFIR